MNQRVAIPDNDAHTGTPVDSDSTNAYWDDEELPPGNNGGSERVEDSIQTYLREIGQDRLLTAEEEVSLAQAIAAGNQARETLLRGEKISGDVRNELLELVAQGEEARRKLIQSNLRLVVSIAKKYHGVPLAFMDLVQEGSIGLMRAVEKFDYTRGNRFSTYATWWIRQSVTRAIAEQGRMIRLPVHLNDSITQLRRAAYRLEQSLERAPTTEELAVALGVSVRKVLRLTQASAQLVSLEQSFGDDSDDHIGDHLAGDEAATPHEVAVQRMLRQDLMRALMKLPERERAILQLRYGLADGRRRTLEEVGSTFGITRERTRQLEMEALRLLRSPIIGARLQAYLD